MNKFFSICAALTLGAFASGCGASPSDQFAEDAIWEQLSVSCVPNASVADFTAPCAVVATAAARVRPDAVVSLVEEGSERKVGLIFADWSTGVEQVTFKLVSLHDFYEVFLMKKLPVVQGPEDPDFGLLLERWAAPPRPAVS